MRKKTVTGLVIGVTIFLISVRYIIKVFEWEPVLQVLAEGNFASFVFGAVLSSFCYWLLRAYRWRILLRVTDRQRISFADLYFCTASGIALGLVTPMQSGEALKVELLRNVAGIRRFNGYSSFILEKALDLVAVLLLATLTLGFSPIYKVNAHLLMKVACLVVVLCAVFGFIVVRFLGTRGGEFGEGVRLLRAYMDHPWHVAAAGLLTVQSWLVVSWAWAWSLSSIGIHLTAVESIAMTSWMTLVNITSFIPGAIGVSEAGTAIWLGNLGFVASRAQAGAVVLRLLGTSLILFGAVHLAIWRVCRRSEVV